jgi:hypothetical protein
MIFLEGWGEGVGSAEAGCAVIVPVEEKEVGGEVTCPKGGKQNTTYAKLPLLKPLVPRGLSCMSVSHAEERGSRGYVGLLDMQVQAIRAFLRENMRKSQLPLGSFNPL